MFGGIALTGFSGLFGVRVSGSLHFRWQPDNIGSAATVFGLTMRATRVGRRSAMASAFTTTSSDGSA